MKKITLILSVALTISGIVGCSNPSSNYQGKKVTFLVGEHEYGTPQSLPKFAAQHLDPLGVESTFIFAAGNDRTSEDCHTFHGIAEGLDSADVLVISIRRRYPVEADMAKIRQWIESGKPTIMVRTASHAFGERTKGEGYQAPAGHASWNTIDVDVLGVSYQGHYREKEGDNRLNVNTWIEESAASHSIVQNLDFSESFMIGDKLYEYIEPDSDIEVLLSARYEEGEPAHPVAWTNQQNGMQVFYMSPGGLDEMALPQIQSLLKSAVLWGLDD